MQPLNSDETVKHQTEISQKLWQVALEPWKRGVLPNPEALAKGRQSLKDTLPSEGLGFDYTRDHILQDIIPGFNAGSLSPNYYGFVTGGSTPAALFADNVVSTYDQNVQVHMANHSIATDIEYNALGLLADLLNLDRQIWQNGTFTTGATASNIMGLACGREFVLRTHANKRDSSINSVGEHGFVEVMQAAGLFGLQILSTMPHSSLGKAAGTLGIGRANVKNICLSQEKPLEIDMKLLEDELAQPGRASIVVISCGEVNTGHFATTGLGQMQQLRALCDKYGSWIHVDGAFGIFGRIIESTPEFASITRGCEGLELADSITGDAHKFLNVPYDCAFFLSRRPSSSLAEDVFRNANAAYLTSGTTVSDRPTIPSPLNIGIENSRRFRALPVYASLIAYGKRRYQDLLQRQIRLSRMISSWLFDHPAYTVLPASPIKEELLDKTFMIVLFRAKDELVNRELTKRINATSKIFVSGTSWEGKPACRIAISNWRADEQRDFAVVTDVLEGIVQKS